MLIALAWSRPSPLGVLIVASLSLVVAFTVAIRTFLRDRRADRRTDPEQVAAWTGPHVDDCEFVVELRAQDDWVSHHAHTVLIRNGGAQPAYNVVLGIAGAAGSIGTEADYLNISVGLVPPRETVEKDLPCWVRHHADHQVAVDVYFNDARELRWRRDPHGRLRKDREWPGRLPWRKKAAAMAWLAQETTPGPVGPSGESFAAPSSNVSGELQRPLP